MTNPSLTLLLLLTTPHRNGSSPTKKKGVAYRIGMGQRFYPSGQILLAILAKWRENIAHHCSVAPRMKAPDRPSLLRLVRRMLTGKNRPPVFLASDGREYVI